MRDPLPSDAGPSATDVPNMSPPTAMGVGLSRATPVPVGAVVPDTPVNTSTRPASSRPFGACDASPREQGEPTTSSVLDCAIDAPNIAPGSAEALPIWPR